MSDDRSTSRPDAASLSVTMSHAEFDGRILVCATVLDRPNAYEVLAEDFAGTKCDTWLMPSDTFLICRELAGGLTNNPRLRLVGYIVRSPMGVHRFLTSFRRLDALSR